MPPVPVCLTPRWGSDGNSRCEIASTRSSRVAPRCPTLHRWFLRSSVRDRSSPLCSVHSTRKIWATTRSPLYAHSTADARCFLARYSPTTITTSEISSRPLPSPMKGSGCVIPCLPAPQARLIARTSSLTLFPDFLARSVNHARAVSRCRYGGNSPQLLQRLIDNSLPNQPDQCLSSLCPSTKLRHLSPRTSSIGLYQMPSVSVHLDAKVRSSLIGLCRCRPGLSSASSPCSGSG